MAQESTSKRPADLPPGFTTEPVATGAGTKGFPGREIAPGEFVEAEAPPAKPSPGAAAVAPAAPKAAPAPSPMNVTPVLAPPSPAAIDQGVAGPLVVPDAVPDLQRVPGAEATDLYWVGTLPGAPVQNIDVAGVNFPLFTETVSVVGGESQRYRHNGELVHLSHSKVQAVLSALRHKIVRWKDANKRRGYLVSIPRPDEAERMTRRGRRFVAQQLDEPVGLYIYMVRGGRTSESAFPPSVVPRKE